MSLPSARLATMCSLVGRLELLERVAGGRVGRLGGTGRLLGQPDPLGPDLGVPLGRLGCSWACSARWPRLCH
jgi:hypothetical protein